MRLGIFAKTFEGSSPRAVLAAARGAGFEAVQYNLACSGLGALPEAIPAGAAEAVRAAAAELEVEVAAVSATYNMIHPDPRARERGRRSFEAIAAAAPAMGCRLVTLCSGTLDPVDPWRRHPDNAGPAAWRDLCQECARLIEIADRHDVWLGIEPELANVVDSARRARELIDALGSDRLRAVLDPANLSEVASPERRRELVEEAVELLAGRIALAHAKDRCADGAFAAAGRGVIDFEHLATVLRRAGYRGALVAHGLAAGEAKGVARHLRAVIAAAERRH